MMGRHQYITEDEYEVNLKDFEPQPGTDRCFRCADGYSVSDELSPRSRLKGKKKKKKEKIQERLAISPQWCYVM